MPPPEVPEAPEPPGEPVSPAESADPNGTPSNDDARGSLTADARPSEATDLTEPELERMKARIERTLASLRERPTSSEIPTQTADSSWSAPSGAPLVEVYVVSWDRPKEQDGTPTTAYVDVTRDVLWLHEGGGISGRNTWYGPFALAER